jgi:hypothetical protein
MPGRWFHGFLRDHGGRQRQSGFASAQTYQPSNMHPDGKEHCRDPSDHNHASREATSAIPRMRRRAGRVLRADRHDVKLIPCDPTHLASSGLAASACVRSSACRGRGARAAAAPPFSGPRSRATVVPCDGRRHQHRGALPASWRPRMGPAPGGTTTALLHPSVAYHAFACRPGAGAGGSGYGRRPHSRWPQPVHERTVLTAQRAGRARCPASVGRRTCPEPPAHAPHPHAGRGEGRQGGLQDHRTGHAFHASRLARSAVQQLK